MKIGPLPEAQRNHHCLGNDPLAIDFCRAARHGDRDALATILDQLMPVLSRVAWRIIGHRWSEGTGEVIASAGVMKGLGSGQFDCSRPLLPWLQTIVRREAIDFLRWHRGMKAIVLSALGNDGPWDVADPLGITPLEELAEREREHESAENRRRMHSAIESLPTVEKQIVTFRLSGLGNQEIARRLAMRSGHVALVFHQAKKRLREGLLGSRR